MAVTHDYECKNEECGVLFEYSKSIKAPFLEECPLCKQKSLVHYMPDSVEFFVARGVTTVAKLMDENSKKLGRYGVQEKEHAIKQEREANKEARRRALEQNLPAGVKLVKNQEHKPWYGKLSDKVDLNNKAAVNKYIATGE